jgi:hypothetical protein
VDIWPELRDENPVYAIKRAGSIIKTTARIDTITLGRD